jgi:hypothetical protein
MVRDRRRLQRGESTRRHSGRIADYRAVNWWVNDDARERYGWLVNYSAEGIGLLTEKADAPAIDAEITPQPRPDLRGWTRTARVRRVEELSGQLALVGAEYRSELDPMPVSPDRRGCPRRSGERRRSRRWSLSKLLEWRVHRGRRIRRSPVVQRSLDGIVLRVASRDVPRVGMRIQPGSRGSVNGFGFRSAIVRRTEAPSRDCRLVFAEIEA